MRKYSSHEFQHCRNLVQKYHKILPQRQKINQTIICGSRTRVDGHLTKEKSEQKLWKMSSCQVQWAMGNKEPNGQMSGCQKSIRQKSGRQKSGRQKSSSQKSSLVGKNSDDRQWAKIMGKLPWAKRNGQKSSGQKLRFAQMSTSNTSQTWIQGN